MILDVARVVPNLARCLSGNGARCRHDRLGSSGALPLTVMGYTTAMFRWLVGLGLLVVASGCQGGGCENDLQCKGDRVCVHQTCVDPEGTPHGAGSDTQHGLADGEPSDAQIGGVHDSGTSGDHAFGGGDETGSHDQVGVAGPCDVMGAGADGAAAADAVLVGVMLPRTGPLEAYGVAMERAVLLALEEFNETGAFGGRQVVGLSCDTGADPLHAATLLTHLADQGVAITVGPATSAVAAAIYEDVASPRKHVLVSPSATSPGLTSLDSVGLFWRTTASDALQGRGIAQFFFESDAVNVAFVHRNDDYGQGIYQAFFDFYCAVTACSDERFLQVAFTPGAVESVEIAEKVAAFGATQVVVVAFPEEGGTLVDALVDQDLDADIVLIDALRSFAVAEAVQNQNALCWALGTSQATPAQSNQLESFRSRHLARFGVEPGLFSHEAYDAAWVSIIAAVESDRRVGHANGEDIADVLGRLSSGTEPIPLGGATAHAILQTLKDGGTVDVSGASGPIDFDAHGDVARDIQSWRFDVPNQTIVSQGVIYTVDGMYVDPEEPVCGNE